MQRNALLFLSSPDIYQMSLLIKTERGKRLFIPAISMIYRKESDKSLLKPNPNEREPNKGEVREA